MPVPGTRRSRTRAVFAFGALLLAAGCGSASEGGGGGYTANPGASPGATEDEGPASLDPGQPGDVATGLEVPWGLAFLPDGSALVTQRDTADVVRVAPDGATTEVGTVAGVSSEGEGGLMGLAVHPDFPGEPYVYAYHTTGSDNRIVRMEYDEGENSLGEPEVLLDGIPAASRHDGGRIAFGPDGLLYAGTGDAAHPDLAQDTDSLAGKVLRMTPGGDPAPDNPFGNHVYSYGHRNVQGLAWDGEGNLYASEFGSDERDEVNLIEAGENYGWPEVEGSGGGDEYADPLVEWSPAEASPSGAAVAGGSLWVAALRGERLWEVPLSGGGEVGEPVAHFQGEYGRLRTVVAAPDGGELWLTTSNRDDLGSPEADDDRVLRVPLE
ncbi:MULTISPECIES: sorbosone dehydrogenase family protein [unclassified Nocardiopsis]|uniref:PQQ-dependent sugar dehydrogenase n=1 Tax=unclassified Nocardiopsis TaxID=2649073 RepID=UPI00135B892F|nr:MULTISPECIES: PQQ-dependent sugar dehydrogenase [unclassified Nocardiopsis]